jgi:hypothetical protein
MKMDDNHARANDDILDRKSRSVLSGLAIPEIREE